MADDERSKSDGATFDPGDSSQVRKALQRGYVPPAPKVPTLSGSALELSKPKPSKRDPSKLEPSPSEQSVSKHSAPTKRRVPPPVARAAERSAKPAAEPAANECSPESAPGLPSSDSGTDAAPPLAKPGHVVSALETRDSTPSSDPSEATPETHDPRPRAVVETRSRRDLTTPGRRRPDAANAPSNAAAPGDAPERSASGNRSSVEVELPTSFDEPDARSTHLSLPAPVARFGRYEVLGRLATGGMAEIYLAQEPIQGGGVRIVVLKVLRKQFASDDEFEQLFLREGRVAMLLAHPHISTVFEFGRWGGHFFIAMEYVEGGTLKEILERTGLHGGRLAPEVAVGIVAKVAGALDYAHTARDGHRKLLGVVHRDVSPHNLMVRFDGVVKLLDFGVAKVGQSDEESRSDAIKGKFGYLAPEQCLSEAVDARTDVFGLGVCLWEALTGRRLYKRGSQYDTFRAILEEPPPSIRELLPELPEDLDALVRKALAKEPDDRFGSAGEMQEALESWLTQRGSVATAARLRRQMAELFADEIRSGPRLEVDSKVHERLRATSMHPPVSTSSRPPAMEATGLDRSPPVAAPRSLRKGRLAAALLAAALLVGAFVMFRSQRTPEPSAAQRTQEAAREEVRLEAERRARERQQADQEAARAEGARATAEREAAAADRAAAEEAVQRASAEREAAERAAAAAAALADEERRREPRVAPQPRRRPGFVTDPGF